MNSLTDQQLLNDYAKLRSEAAREPAFNLQKARVYLAASDPEVATRTWQNALDTMVATKRAGSANRDRWETFAKNKGLKPLLKLVVLETRADQLLDVVVKGPSRGLDREHSNPGAKSFATSRVWH